MKTARKLLCLALALLMIIPCFAYSVSAADHTSEADTLKNLGLFKGTDKGYELDRTPTRAEAAVMLVRFLGKEEAALKLKWSAPFNDVPDWAKPYVQYLYNEGLTSGTSATKYSPDNLCTAQQYATFMLRALGYKDGTASGNVEEGIVDPKADVTLLKNVKYVDMKLNDPVYDGFKVKTSIVDVWPGDKSHDVGHLFEVGKDYTPLYDAVISSGDGGAIETYAPLHTAGTDSVYIFNGKPGDKDFGQKVFVNLYEGFGAVLGISDANPFGSFNMLVMLSGFWRKKADVSLSEGYYTFVVYGENGPVGFTEYIIHNALEDQYSKKYENGGPKKKDTLKSWGKVEKDNEYYGYDFSYNDAISFAREKKLVTDSNCNEKKFLRDHMVSISYTALQLSTAKGDYRALIYKLADGGAVTSTQAREFMGDSTASGDYLAEHSDFDAMNAWLTANIEGTDTPPVYFKLGTKKSTDMKWTKSVGKSRTVTDYPDSDNPVKRTLTDITYTNSADDLKLVLTLTSYSDYPVIEYDAVLTNTASKNSSTVSEFSCINTSIGAAGKTEYLHYNKGSSSAFEDYTPYTKKLENSKKISLKTENGQPTQEYLPYFNAENRTEQNGIIAAVNWQGNWFADFELKNGNVTLKAGQYGANFAMLKGESFKVPGMVLLFYKNGDWQEGQNVWRRWIIEHNLMRYTGRRDFKQNVFLCSGYEGFEKDLSDIKKLKGSAVAKNYNCVFEIDAGWYECGGNWQNWYYTGNWNVASNYPGDSLKKMSDACKDAGVGFCLWMEPERFYVGTPEANTLGPDNYIALDGGLALINYGKQAAQDYVVNLVDGVVKSYGLTVYRQDFNTSNEPFWDLGDKNEAAKYGINRSGATENHACEGYINTWRRIAELNPGLIFDSCAGGGRRNDLETLRFSFMHTKSDYYADVVSQQCQNFGALSWYIFTGTGFGNMTTYDIRTRLTLSVGVGAVVNSTVNSALKEWSSMQEYMYCDYYQLSTFDSSVNGNLALEFNDYESGEGYMLVYLRSGGDYTLKARGLDADSNYKVYDKEHKSDAVIMTGNELMTKGFTVSRKSGTAYAPVVIFERQN